MKLGKLIVTNMNGVVTVAGDISTYAVHLPFRLEVNPDRQTDKSPTHNIIAKGKGGQAFSAGVAWQGKTKGTPAKPMYTLNFNVPEIWPAEMDLVAFQNADGTTFDIQHSKPQQVSAAA